MLSSRSTLRTPGRCVCPCLVSLTWMEFFCGSRSQQQTVKRSDETHEFCKISPPFVAFSTLTDYCRPMRTLLYFYQVSDEPLSFHRVNLIRLAWTGSLYYQLPFGNLNDSTNALPDQDALVTLPSRLHAQGREGHSKEPDELDLGRPYLLSCSPPNRVSYGVQVSQFGDIPLLGRRSVKLSPITTIVCSTIFISPTVRRKYTLVCSTVVPHPLSLISRDCCSSTLWMLLCIFAYASFSFYGS